MREYALLESKRELEPMAVVDIGSNSVRLVVYEGAVRSPTPIFNEKVLCGLGRAIASTGRLDDESIRRALEALARFKAITRLLDVKHVRAIATAACRDAVNGSDFIARGERALGTRIQVLSGQQEAQLAANGILMGFLSPDGLAGDLGGGSLEIIDVAGNALRQSATLAVGGLRLLDASGGRMDKAIDIVDELVSGVAWRSKGRGRSFYAVGGTWRAIARLHMNERDYPLHVMHGYSMPAKEAAAFCEDIRKAKKLSAMKGSSEIARPRREVLPFGAVVLERLLKHLEPSGSCSRCSASARVYSTACCRRGNGARTRSCRSARITRAYVPARPSMPRSCADGRMRCSNRLGRARPRRKGGCGMRPACCPT
jgi:exopolyphosphatase/guanosine-5'-triphosphate,3'-diphosphate pyrophosphatase